jgi:predicted metal-dependent HD superfamily phosphohydrolase
MARNSLSAEAAQARISSQMTNSERISHADVILSTLFAPDETQVIVERAWKFLEDRMSQRRNTLSGFTLEARFHHLVKCLAKAAGVSDQESDAVQLFSTKWWKFVETAYSEPQRHYHTLEHISALSQLFDYHRHACLDPWVILSSIFFHDIVYDTKAKGGANELGSAAIWKQFSQELIQLSPSLSPNASEYFNAVVNEVNEIIIKTASHTSVGPTSSDADFFLDLDLSVLASPPEVYAIYANQIRQEYSPVPYAPAAYVAGRIQVLKTLSNSATKLYRSRILRMDAAEIARRNMAQEIATLELDLATFTRKTG